MLPDTFTGMSSYFEKKNNRKPVSDSVWLAVVDLTWTYKDVAPGGLLDIVLFVSSLHPYGRLSTSSSGDSRAGTRVDTEDRGGLSARHIAEGQMLAFILNLTILSVTSRHHHHHHHHWSFQDEDLHVSAEKRKSQDRVLLQILSVPAVHKAVSGFWWVNDDCHLNCINMKLSVYSFASASSQRGGSGFRAWITGH